VAWASVNPSHRALHGTSADAVQGFLAVGKPPARHCRRGGRGKRTGGRVTNTSGLLRASPTMAHTPILRLPTASARGTVATDSRSAAISGRWIGGGISQPWAITGHHNPRSTFSQLRKVGVQKPPSSIEGTRLAERQVIGSVANNRRLGGRG
jgi:hypothetical protein